MGRTFGGRYESMVILDADSMMTGDAVVRIAAGIENNPQVGLIQTLPIIVNGHTLFARLQQFAGRLYGPMLARGIAWWYGTESNYWGHNAAIRVQAFAAHARLPLLAGRKPFGGHILSHDFVEAALMRRAGWPVVMVPALLGSYEETPPSITEFAARDRRWCQGNLQRQPDYRRKGAAPDQPRPSRHGHHGLYVGLDLADLSYRRAGLDHSGTYDQADIFRR